MSITSIHMRHRCALTTHKVVYREMTKQTTINSFLTMINFYKYGKVQANRFSYKLERKNL